MGSTHRGASVLGRGIHSMKNHSMIMRSHFLPSVLSNVRHALVTLSKVHGLILSKHSRTAASAQSALAAAKNLSPGSNGVVGESRAGDVGDFTRAGDDSASSVVAVVAAAVDARRAEASSKIHDLRHHLAVDNCRGRHGARDEMRGGGVSYPIWYMGEPVVISGPAVAK